MTWIALGATTTGCTQPADDEVGSDESQVVTGKVHEGPEVVSCSVTEGRGSPDPLFRTHRVKCTSTLPADYPLQLVGTLNAFTAKNATSGAFLQDLATAPFELEIAEDHFPVTVKIDVTLQGKPSEPVVNLEHTKLTQELKLAVTTAAPAVVKIPFDIWPVAYVAREVDFRGDVAEATLDLGGMTSNGAPTLTTKRHISLASLGQTKQVLYAVAPGSSLKGEGTFGATKLPFEIDAAGTYAAHADGLRVVRAEAPVPKSAGAIFGGCTGQPSAATPGSVDVVCTLLDERDGVKVSGGTASLVVGGEETAPVPLALALPKDTVVGTVPADATDGEVVVTATFTSKFVGLPNHIAQAPLVVKLPLADVLASQDNTLTLPFESWGVTFRTEASTLALVEVPSYVVAMNKPWSSVESFRTTSELPSVEEGSTQTLYFAADSNAEAIEAMITTVSIESGQTKDYTVKLVKGHTYDVTPAGVTDVTN